MKDMNPDTGYRTGRRDMWSGGQEHGRERTSGLCGAERLGVLGLVVLGARLLNELLLVLVLGLGVGSALLRRDGPLVGEAVKDAEGQGRVPEDL
jgi:hypothetical protein